MVAIGHRLIGFGDSHGAERRARDYFSAMHSSEAEQLHAFSEGWRHKIAFRPRLHDHSFVWRRWRRRLLRSGGPCVKRRHAREGQGQN